MDNYNLDRIAKNLISEIEEDLSRIGIMHRIFYRCKSHTSVNLKMTIKNYDGEKTFLRDLIGLRINVYFVDDLHIVSKFLLGKYYKMDEAVDKINQTEFKPTRINYVFRIPDQYHREFKETVLDNRIDCTFELQLRTVLSEGWHEVEHDLRYKQKDHWVDHEDLSRVFNGILASLETNDWSMLSLLEKLAYRHYKLQNWDAMIRTKVRLRLDSSQQLSESLSEIFTQDTDLAKYIFKLDRNLLLQDLFSNETRFPLTVNNVIFFINSKYLTNDKVSSLVPSSLQSTFKCIK